MFLHITKKIRPTSKKKKKKIHSTFGLLLKLSNERRFMKLKQFNPTFFIICNFCLQVSKNYVFFFLCVCIDTLLCISWPLVFVILSSPVLWRWWDNGKACTLHLFIVGIFRSEWETNPCVRKIHWNFWGRGNKPYWILWPEFVFFSFSC